MDELLLVLRRKAASGSVSDLQNYISALERLTNLSQAPAPKPYLFLLSTEGERHEDRLPLGIFTSKAAAHSFIYEYVQLEYSDNINIELHEQLYDGDYGDYIEISYSFIDDDEEQEHEDDVEINVVGPFFLDRFWVNPSVVPPDNLSEKDEWSWRATVLEVKDKDITTEN